MTSVADDVTSAGGRAEFLTSAWLDLVRFEIERALAGEDLRGIDFTTSEEYTGVPEHLQRDGQPIGYFIRIREERVEVGNHPVHDADLRMTVDYEVGLEAVRRELGEHASLDDPERAARLRGYIEAGKLRIQGDPSKSPDVLRRVNLHDRIAARTA